MGTASTSRACPTRTKNLDEEPRPNNLRGVMSLVLHASTFKSVAVKEGMPKEAEAEKAYILTLQEEGTVLTLKIVASQSSESCPH